MKSSNMNQTLKVTLAGVTMLGLTGGLTHSLLLTKGNSVSSTTSFQQPADTSMQIACRIRGCDPKLANEVGDRHPSIKPRVINKDV